MRDGVLRFAHGLRAVFAPGSSGDLCLHVGLLGLMWGSGFMFIKLALEGFTPFEITFARLAAAALVMQAVVALRGDRGSRSGREDTSVWGWIVLFALLANVLPYMLVTWAVTNIPTTAAAITNATTPVFTALLAVALAIEARPGALRAAGIALGLTGVALMFGFGITGGSAWGRLALFLAAFSFACSFVIASVGSLRAHSLAWLSANQLTIAAALLAPFAIGDLVTAPVHFAPGPIAALLALALFTTALGTVTYMRAVRRVGPSSASLATYLVPVVGALLGVSLLHEPLRLETTLGAAVVLVGVWLAERGRADLRGAVA